MAKNNKKKSEDGKLPIGSVSQTEEFGVETAIQLFGVNKRELMYLRHTYKDAKYNVVEWKGLLDDDEIMCGKNPVVASDSTE